MKYKIIQIIAEDKISGAPRHLLDLVKGLLKDKKFAIKVICPPGKVAQAFQKMKVEVVPTRMRSKFDFGAVGRLRAIIKQELIQAKKEGVKVIVHCHGLRGGWLGRLAAIGQKPKVIYTEHLWTRDYSLPSRLGHIFQVCGLWFLDLFTTTTIAVSNAVAEFLILTKITRAEKIAVIPHGVEEVSRPKKAAPDKIFSIGSVGSLNPIKGYDYLLKALGKFKRERPRVSWQLTIVGEGQQEGTLKKLAQKLGLSRQVHFVGFQEDVEKTLAKFNLYIQPSLSESFGLAAAQAMAFGVPVIVCAVGGLPEILGVGEWSETLDKGQFLQTDRGLLVASKDSVGLGRAIEFVVDHPQEAAKMAKCGQKYIRDNFTFQKMIDGTKRVYEKVAR